MKETNFTSTQNKEHVMNIDMSKYNNNYINTFLERVEQAVEDDLVIPQEDYDKAMAFYDHKAGVLQRRAERLKESDVKLDVAEAEWAEKFYAEQNEYLADKEAFDADPWYAEPFTAEEIASIETKADEHDEDLDKEIAAEMAAEALAC